MSRSTILAAFCYFILVLELTNQVFAQVTPGFPPFAAYDSHEVDTVDLMDNNVILRVPVMSKSGSIDFGVAANSYMASSGTWSPSMSFLVNVNTGAPFTPGAYGLLSPGSVLAQWTTSSPGPTCSDGSQTTWLSGFSFATSDGTVHLVNPTSKLETADSDSLCHNQSVTLTAIDNSGLTATFTSQEQGSATLGTVYLRNGASLTHSSLTDRYGNSLTQLSGCGSTSCNYQDAMGLTVLSMSTSSGITQPSYSWTDVKAGTPTVNQSTTPLTLKTNFACSEINDLNNSSTTLMTNGFSFPDGTSLGLTYEGTPGSSGKYTGRINQITLREGGTVSYTYGGANNGIDCTYQTVPVLTRTLGNGDQTTYTLTHALISGSNYNAVNTVVDPGGNKTVYTFTGFTSTGAAAAPTAQAVTQVQYYQGLSTLLATDVYCYNTAFASCSFTTAPTSTVTLPVSSEVIMHKLNGMSKASATEYHYDTFGNVTYVASYDFGASSPALTSTITYGTCSAGCNTSSPTIVAIGSNINNLQGEVVSSQNGSTVAQTNYNYSSNGSLLTTYRWTGSQWLSNTTPNVYNSNGSLSKTFDLANNETDYAYAASGYIGCSSCTSFPFPTQIKNAGTGDYINSTWYGVGGVKSADTDRNGNTTTYCYNTGASCLGGTADPYWRPLQRIDPLLVTADFTYPTVSSPDAVGYSMEFNGNNSIDAVTLTTDGYGRQISVQRSQLPSGTNYDTTTFSYNNSSTTWQEIFSSQPCSTTANGSCTTSHTYQYDPLGRLHQTSTTSNETVAYTYTDNDVAVNLTPAPSGENTKQEQDEYDGLGRLESRCYIGNGIATACGQNNNALSGFTETITYGQGTGYTTVTTTRSSESRTFQYDAMGRVTSKTIPEASGSWTYTYDSNSSCPSGIGGSAGQAGRLASSQDPNGNLLCYYYDTQGRVTEVNADGTACRYYYYGHSTGYDGTLPTGVSLTNPYGRLVEAATDSCQTTHTTGTLLTDEWFAYDADGRILNMWESTPHSTQYYQSTATFYGNGAVNTLTLASPSLYEMTYGLDGEGRWNTLKDTTSNIQIVTGATYYPTANPAVISLTGTTPDSDSYTYDVNTGSMQEFVFTVGNTPATLTGMVNWNANGTLNNVAVTDGFNAGGSLTCSSVYDDWIRLASFLCGSGNEGEDYSYDNYDNLTKTVPTGYSGTTWNPGYSSSTNHYNVGSYDSNGNVTSDTNNVWGWNEFSKMRWTATSGTPTCGTSGKCIVYDAFGRIVETSNGSTWKERWITQMGETANMSGATVNFAYWPAPEGGTALVIGNSSAFYYLHKDWLGSARVVETETAHNVYADRAFTPYGEMFATFGTSNARHDMFATLTDNFDSSVQWDTPNRELSIVGRWLSPDPINETWNGYAYVANNPLSFTDPTGLLLKGPGNTCVGDTDGIVCGNAATDMIDGGGGGGWSNGTFGTVIASGGTVGGNFCDASGSCLGIATCPGGLDENGNCAGGVVNGVCQGTIDAQGSCQGGFSYAGGTTGFGAITLPGAIQFGAAAFTSSYNQYLTGLATTITTTQFELGLITIPISTVTSTDTGYLAFLTWSAPTLSPYSPIPGVNQPPGKPPTLCSVFPNKSCFPKKPPNPLFWQFLTIGNTATPFGDLVP